MGLQGPSRWERAQKAVHDSEAVRQRTRETRAWARNVRWVVVLQRALRQRIAERRKPPA